MDAIDVILVATILGFPQSWSFGDAASQYIMAARGLLITAVFYSVLLLPGDESTPD